MTSQALDVREQTATESQEIRVLEQCEMTTAVVGNPWVVRGFFRFHLRMEVDGGKSQGYADDFCGAQPHPHPQVDDALRHSAYT